MDKSLETIISNNKLGRRRNPRRATARTQLLGKPASPAARVSNRVRAAAAPVKATVATQAVPTSADKIIVSNLPTDVNEAQVKELFASTVGPTKEVSLSYDASGRSKGIAAVTFSKKGDANKAHAQYNNRLIDGKRPMKIEIVVDPSRPPPLSARVAPASTVNSAQAKTVATGRTSIPRSGRSVKRTRRVAKTAADLDADMEDYNAANAPAAAAAPATTTA